MGADHQGVGCGSELRHLSVAQPRRSMGLNLRPIDEGVVVGSEVPVQEPVCTHQLGMSEMLRERRFPLLRWPDSAMIASGLFLAGC
jgi:hypothetical protein